MEIKDILIYIVTPLLSLIIIIFNLYLNTRFTSLREKVMGIEKDIDKIKEEEEKMKCNYLDRFEKVLSGISDIKVSIVQIQGSVERQAQLCEIFREQKLKE